MTPTRKLIALPQQYIVPLCDGCHGSKSDLDVDCVLVPANTTVTGCAIKSS
ncbi:hypothetical protein JYT28_01755 [Desulfobulbus sp. AH-315-M07]|nr:hypothetical protein [Desulfobulbus sp. AH-315-M07]